MARTPAVLPSKRDIKKACDEIQKSWSKDEREKREPRSEPFQIPSIACCEINAK